MKYGSKILVWSAAIGLLIPQAGIAAAANPNVAPARQAPRPTALTDVALTAEGQLRGQVVDRNGNAQAQMAISVLADEQVVARTVTDPQGYFSVPLARGGVYRIANSQGATPLRVWTKAAAPPTAKNGILFVSDRELARGEPGERAELLPWVLVGGMVTGIAVFSNLKPEGS